MFDYHLFGLNPGGYHLTNLMLHLFSVLLIFGLFHRMTKAIWKSAFASALFAIHPLHVESAAWISERKGVLNAFLRILTLFFYALRDASAGLCQYQRAVREYDEAIRLNPDFDKAYHRKKIASHKLNSISYPKPAIDKSVPWEYFWHPYFTKQFIISMFK